MLTGQYQELYDTLQKRIPADRLIHDPLGTLAFGTDASFYRLIPQLVIKVENEEEVRLVMGEAANLGLPYTFRAAGTSLSGQAISDSLLIILGREWKKYSILENGNRIRLQPGIVGAHANIFLAPYGRKIGPDPASINACMIGGIIANNSSGMCCGTAQNSYKTLHSMRVVLSDGAVLDMNDESSKSSFLTSHRTLCDQLTALSQRVKQDSQLATRIRGKYAMKNTTGYSLNALVDFDDPLEILQHLMVGSEGTLGFISEVTLHTVPEHPHKATALILFPDIETACKAVPLLKDQPVSAVELMDRASLHSVEGKEGIPEYFNALPNEVAALLVETRSADAAELAKQVEAINASIATLKTVREFAFETGAAENARLWNIRKGLFPSVGAMRERGTTVIIEDVAFPIPKLAEATLALQKLFKKYRYGDSIIFGHALDGNLHFVFSQDFGTGAEVERYAGFMQDVAEMVVNEYDGALKAEHGTGRNMAPFVELEWGAEAYGIMKEIKRIFDPHNLINPGVLLNDDSRIHLKNLKPLPPADPIIDKCIECGFCEVHCPSKDLTLTPRHRIVIQREIARLKVHKSDRQTLRELEERYHYQGNQTCATDGLCALACPVGIDTGSFIKELRGAQAGKGKMVFADIVAGNFSVMTSFTRAGLKTSGLLRTLVGDSTMESISAFARRFTENKLPLWNKFLPGSARAVRGTTMNGSGKETVVYFPCCITRTMGPAPGDEFADDVPRRTLRLLAKAGYNVIIPENVDNLCCGMPFSSKGLAEAGEEKRMELESALLHATKHGEYLVYMDTSPCVYTLKGHVDRRLAIHDPVRFILERAAGTLEFARLPETVAVHSTCSSRKMGLEEPLKKLASLCAEKVVVPHGIECCGWAGDRGFTFPELNASALQDLQSQTEGCAHGYSTSRTCEIGMSLHSGIHYSSIVYLVDKCTIPKRTR